MLCYQCQPVMCGVVLRVVLEHLLCGVFGQFPFTSITRQVRDRLQPEEPRLPAGGHSLISRLTCRYLLELRYSESFIPRLYKRRMSR